MEKLISLPLQKETPQYFKFKLQSQDIIITVYLKKELLSNNKPEKIEIKISEV